MMKKNPKTSLSGTVAAITAVLIPAYPHHAPIITSVGLAACALIGIFGKDA